MIKLSTPFLKMLIALISKIKGEAPSEVAASAPISGTCCFIFGIVHLRKNPVAIPIFPMSCMFFLDEGCGMENLRAYMLVVSIQDFCAEADFLFEPAAVENDASTAEQVIKDGFLLMFKHAEDREKAIPVVRTAGSVRSYQPHDYHPAPVPASLPAPESSSAPAQSPKASVPLPAPGAQQVSLPRIRRRA